MPLPNKVNPQTRSSEGSRSKKGGSVWDDVVPIEEADELGIKMVIFGRNGSGKTTLACTFPKPLLLLGFEDGKKSVKKVEGVHWKRVWETSQLHELARGVVERGFQTVVLDTATSLQDLVLKEILGLKEVPVQLAWGMVDQKQYQARSEKTRELMRLFIDLADRHPVNVVILGQEKDHTKKTDAPRVDHYADEGIIKPFIATSLGETTAGWLHDNVDYINQTFTVEEVIKKTKFVGEGKNRKESTVEKKTGRVTFCLRMDRSHPIFGAKIRADRNVEIPSILYRPDYDRFVAALNGELEDNEPAPTAE